MKKSLAQQAYEAGRRAVIKHDKSRNPRTWEELDTAFRKGFEAIVLFVSKKQAKP